MDDEDVSQMLDGIEKIAQCPVCLDLAKGPVAQCTNGHITCGTCRESLEECSMCREPFIETVNRIVEELLNFLPKACPYTDEGCGAVSLLDNHSQYCKFRPIKCIVGEDKSCEWSGTIDDWKEHVKNEHEDYIFESKFKQPFTLSLSDFNSDSWNSDCYFLQIDEEVFLLYVWKEGNKFCQILRHIQCNKTKKEYYVVVKFASQELLFYKSLIESSPFKEDEPLEKNPVIFLLMDLTQSTKGDGRLDVEVEAREYEMPKKK